MNDSGNVEMSFTYCAFYESMEVSFCQETKKKIKRCKIKSLDGKPKMKSYSEGERRES